MERFRKYLHGLFDKDDMQIHVFHIFVKPIKFVKRNIINIKIKTFVNLTFTDTFSFGFSKLFIIRIYIYRMQKQN